MNAAAESKIMTEVNTFIHTHNVRAHTELTSDDQPFLVIVVQVYVGEGAFAPSGEVWLHRDLGADALWPYYSGRPGGHGPNKASGYREGKEAWCSESLYDVDSDALLTAARAASKKFMASLLAAIGA